MHGCRSIVVVIAQLRDAWHDLVQVYLHDAVVQVDSLSPMRQHLQMPNGVRERMQDYTATAREHTMPIFCEGICGACPPIRGYLGQGTFCCPILMDGET